MNSSGAIRDALESGSRLLALGHYREAMAAAQTAHELDNTVGGPILLAAVAAAGLWREADARRFLAIAAERDPNHPQLDVARAQVFVRFGSSEALAPAERAVARAPREPEALCLLGRALHRARRPQEALVALDRAIAASRAAPGPAAVEKAAVLRSLGRFDEARCVVAGILAADPRNAVAWFERSMLDGFAPGDPDLERMRALLEPGVLANDEQRMTLLFALGDASLSADPERAFSYLDEANRLKRATFAYDEAETRRFCETLPALFDRQALEAAREGGDPSELPIFVVGMPRSGTTLVEQILASHQDVHGAGEVSFFVDALKEAGLGSGLPGPERTSDESLRRVAASYLAALRALAPGKRRIIDKALLNTQTLGFVRLALPNARIVHVRRDPLDTCLSIYRKHFNGNIPYGYDQGELGRYYRIHAALMAHWRSVLPSDRFLEIDYEALVADLETQARALLDFCGLDWDDACLRFHETERAVLTASSVQVRRPLYRTSVGNAQRFDRELAPLLAALGGEAAHGGAVRGQ
jgi:tetratricopeptide (TPR) repeat protein